ncbi:MAG: hypothetical protein PPP58_06560 [Natronomonas sp.]
MPTPDRIQQRLEETEGRVDPSEVVDALSYVRDDGRRVIVERDEP